jgi:hypothetical protein
MNKTRARKAAPAFHESQPSFLPGESAERAVLHRSDRQARVMLTADLSSSVTVQQVAHGPIRGHYTVETQDMREPLGVRWSAQDGTVLDRCARSTEIAFDLGGTGAGQLWTSVVGVQVTEAETFDTIILGTFVQIRVMDA